MGKKAKALQLILQAGPVAFGVFKHYAPKLKAVLADDSLEQALSSKSEKQLLTSMASGRAVQRRNWAQGVTYRIDTLQKQLEENLGGDCSADDAKKYQAWSAQLVSLRPAVAVAESKPNWRRRVHARRQVEQALDAISSQALAHFLEKQLEQ